MAEAPSENLPDRTQSPDCIAAKIAQQPVEPVAPRLVHHRFSQTRRSFQFKARWLWCLHAKSTGSRSTAIIVRSCTAAVPAAARRDARCHRSATRRRASNGEPRIEQRQQVTRPAFVQRISARRDRLQRLLRNHLPAISQSARSRRGGNACRLPRDAVDQMQQRRVDASSASEIVNCWPRHRQFCQTNPQRAGHLHRPLEAPNLRRDNVAIRVSFRRPDRRFTRRSDAFPASFPFAVCFAAFASAFVTSIRFTPATIPAARPTPPARR